MGLSLFEQLQVAGAALAFLGAVAAFLWGRSRAEATEHQAIKSLERQMDEANARSSKLASFVHELPTQKDTTELWHAVSELRKESGHMRERLAALESR